MSEKFNLRWHDFGSNASKSFRLFRNETYLHDVTLVSDDFKQIPAHKLVLSACSEYFRNILQQTKQAQPLLCLEGINQTDLQYILDYVYDGEVKIQQQELDRFLNIAQRLKLEGLMGAEDHKQKEESLDEDMVEQIQEKDLNMTAHNFNKIPIQPHERNTAYENKLMKISDHNLDGNASFGEQNAKLDEMIVTNADGTISCSVCGKVAKEGRRPYDTRNNLRNHVETHLEGLLYNCPLCDKTFRSRNSLNCHKSLKHKPKY